MPANVQQSPREFDDLLGLEPEVEAVSPPQNPPTLISESDLAERWGVSTRQVRKLVQEGVLRKPDGKRFDFTEATRAYIARLIEQASRRAANDPELRDEKLRLAREQADQLELKNAAARGELVSASAVKAKWADVLRDVRAGMLAVPSRIAQRLSHLTPTDLDHIDREIRDALQETANGNA